MTLYALYFAKALAFIGSDVFLLCSAAALRAWRKQWVARRRVARIAAMLEYRHVWKEVQHRVVDNTFSSPQHQTK